MAPATSGLSPIPPVPEAVRLCENLFRSPAGNSTTHLSPALNLDAAANAGADQPTDLTDNVKSDSDSKPEKLISKSLYFCHPTSARVFLRCDVRAVQIVKGITPFKRLLVVHGEALTCAPGTFFNSVIKVGFAPPNFFIYEA